MCEFITEEKVSRGQKIWKSAFRSSQKGTRHNTHWEGWAGLAEAGATMKDSGPLSTSLGFHGQVPSYEPGWAVFLCVLFSLLFNSFSGLTITWHQLERDISISTLKNLYYLDQDIHVTNVFQPVSASFSWGAGRAGEEIWDFKAWGKQP